MDENNDDDGAKLNFNFNSIKFRNYLYLNY